MNVIEQITAEVARATVKFPTWPTDPLHALAVLGEEYGELTKAMLQLTYEPHKTTLEEVRTEAIQTAAMALRLAMSLDRYEYRRGEQHSQNEDIISGHGPACDAVCCCGRDEQKAKPADRGFGRHENNEGDTVTV